MVKNVLIKNQANFYLALRVIVGALFMLHGAGKLFGGLEGITGMLGNLGVPAAGFMALLVGAIEFFGGIFILVGLFVRPAALLSGVVMLFALLLAHFPKGLNPLDNGGENALLFLVSFLVLMGSGAGKASLEVAWLGKEKF